MKTNAIVRIVLFSIAILVLLGILAAVLLVGTFMVDFSDPLGSNADNISSDQDPINIDLNGSVDTAAVNNISIEWVSGSIIIRPGDTDQITFSESDVTNEKDKMVWKIDGDTLEIQYCKDSIEFPSFGINVDFSKDLIITVPAEWICDTLEIDAASASVNVQDMTINEVDFDGASGACKFDNCVVGEISMDTASGDVEFVGCLDVLDFDGASANCSIYVANVPRQIEIETASGDLNLYLPEECGFSCELTTLSGQFSSDFKTTTHNSHHVYGDGSCIINVDAMSGNVNICKNINAHTNNHSSSHHKE